MIPDTYTAPGGDSGQRWHPAPLILFSFFLHAAGAVTVAVRPEWWACILSALAGNYLLLGAAVMFPRTRWLGPNLVRLPASAVRRREVCLTFDDGPDPQVTPRVLEILDRFQAKASFFCVGRKAETYSDLVKEIERRGHSVENHSNGHSHAFALFGWFRLKREVDGTQDVLRRITGRLPQFFRAPAGFRSPLLDPILTGRGLIYVSWTRRGFDAVSRDPSAILRRLTRGLAAGDVILLHDTKPVVLEVLPALLEQLALRGLRTVSLPGAFGDRSPA
jgi:peptidoglycan/xylan/chitin deacetylase (PgdA/CDA1 family)